MRYRSNWIMVAFTIAAVVLLMWPRSISAGEPIDGVDVKLGKNPPGGKIVGTATTGRDGKFVFENVAPGKYLLDVPKTRAIVTSRSNIKRPSSNLRNGVEEHELFIEFGTGRETKRFMPIEIEITAKRGKIIGVITNEAAPKKSGKR